MTSLKQALDYIHGIDNRALSDKGVSELMKDIEKAILTHIEKQT